ncbi:hypothetical protein BHG07_11650 [Brenneria salicis ATCC 15712 = DSM 30166]|uniref:Uncharacterized protein n=1 Tax=Brenneria salicis ATCC 15712 = DSM 30166 TaxID=714314 RepID=A0A366I4G0_9GAMM|nr:hypothetical protein DES54_12463 [Brenneria salicis ATCC 15712 = DSM 30166]RLM30315.1 hypothetical protein BHG07_11650 [Brenneria salicis ATCC 15712 = DSM 30166]
MHSALLRAGTNRESEPSGDTKTKIAPLTEKNHDDFPTYSDLRPNAVATTSGIPIGAVRLIKNEIFKKNI